MPWSAHDDPQVEALRDFARSKLELEEKMKDWHPKRRARIEAARVAQAAKKAEYALAYADMEKAAAPPSASRFQIAEAGADLLANGVIVVRFSV